MVLQYPDFATIQSKPSDAVNNGGVLTPGTIQDDISVQGRYEPTTLNKELQISNGSFVKLKGIFYMPLSAPEIDTVSNITITNKLGENIISNGKVLFFTRGELNCRLFL